VGPRVVLDAVVNRKIASLRRESNPRTPIVQPVARRYGSFPSIIGKSKYGSVLSTTTSHHAMKEQRQDGRGVKLYACQSLHPLGKYFPLYHRALLNLIQICRKGHSRNNIKDVNTHAPRGIRTLHLMSKEPHNERLPGTFFLFLDKCETLHSDCCSQGVKVIIKQYEVGGGRVS
jgi:hypothetical protein